MDTMAITGATIVSHEFGQARRGIVLARGKIAEVLRPGAAIPKVDRIIDASGLHVLPGIIDPHVHLGNHREMLSDTSNQTQAALWGGTTTVFTFLKAAQFVSYDTPYSAFVEPAVELLRKGSYCNVGCHLVVSDPSQLTTAELAWCRARGLTSFKFFMGYRGDAQARARGTIALDDGEILMGYRAIAAMGISAIAMTHAENEDINRALLQALVEREGRPPTLSEWYSTRADIGEAQSISMACSLAAKENCSLYLVHVGSALGLQEALTRKRRSASPIHVEVNTHNLCLTADAGNTLEREEYAKTTPALRSREDIEYLWAGIAGGGVDTVATDSVAMNLDKKIGVLDAAPGFVGVDVHGSAVLSEGMRRGVSLERLSAVLSHAPAQIFGLSADKGDIREGMDADLVVWDLNSPWQYRAAASVSTAVPSPYDGLVFRARPLMTILAGQTVCERGMVSRDRLGSVLTASEGDGSS